MMNPNLAGLLAIIMWSISPLLIIGAGETPPFLLGALALFFASFLLFGRSIYLKHDIRSLFAHSKIAYILATYGIGGYVIFWLLGFENAPAFEANTLNYAWPILLVLFSHLLAKEKLTLSVILGISLGFLGITMLFWNMNMNSGGEVFLLGYIFAFLGAFIWATYSSLTRYVSFSSHAMAIFMFIPAVMCLVMHIQLETIYFPTFMELFFVILLGMTRISFVFWDYAMKYGKVSFISSLSYFIPIISTFLLMIFGFIPRDEVIFVSAIFVITGCLAVNYHSLLKLFKR